jgi:hypothetical protein
MTVGCRFPSSFQYPQPIFEAQFFNERFAKPAAAQQSHDRLQLGGTSQAGRHFCAVEIGAETDAVLADTFQNMVDVFQNQVGSRICVATAVRPQVAGREGKAHQPLALANCGQLPVGEIARMRAHLMRVGMSGDERRITDGSDKLCPSKIGMRRRNSMNGAPCGSVGSHVCIR